MGHRCPSGGRAGGVGWGHGTLWAMHGMLSAAIMIVCFAVIAVAAVIAVLRIYRGGTHE
jgi:hypothetical protein